VLTVWSQEAHLLEVMTSERPFTALWYAGFLVLAGAACGKTTTSSGGDGGSQGNGGALPGTGGESAGGGTTGRGGATGAGGATSAGGTSASGGMTGTGGSAGTGGAAGSSGGAKGSGGIPAGGASGAGTGGVTGSGGSTMIRDAAARDSMARDGSAVIDLPGQRDVAIDIPGNRDTGTANGGDGGCVPDYACKPTSPNTGDIYADCAARVNQFRACVCLPPLPRWTAGEACADQDAQYDSQQNTAHAGFQAGICASGNAQDECPNWTGSTPEKVIDGCLQMMFDEGPPPTATCTGQCYSDHGHYINMTGTKYKNGVACGFYTTASGGIWAAQNFQ
jgi:hypothetical protein